MDIVVEPVVDLPMISFARLVIESEREGWFFVRRLAEEWSSGANRFQRPGERLYLAHFGNLVVGVCGFNIDLCMLPSYCWSCSSIICNFRASRKTDWLSVGSIRCG